MGGVSGVCQSFRRRTNFGCAEPRWRWQERGCYRRRYARRPNDWQTRVSAGGGTVPKLAWSIDTRCRSNRLLALQATTRPTLISTNEIKLQSSLTALERLTKRENRFEVSCERGAEEYSKSQRRDVTQRMTYSLLPPTPAAFAAPRCADARTAHFSNRNVADRSAPS